MTPGIADGLAITFYFVFYTAIFWMIEHTVADVFHAMSFSWLVVYACAAAFAYCTVWLDKQSG